MAATLSAVGPRFAVSAGQGLGGSIVRWFGRPLATLPLTIAFAVSGGPVADAAENWIGPNDTCASDMLLRDWAGLRSHLSQYGVTFGLTEQSEVWGNLTGGLKQGTAYDGLTTASLCIDLATATKGRWEGAHFFISGIQIHGIGPTPQLVGALQLVSSIEATPSTKLYDLWLEQQAFGGKFSLRFGQEGANDEFMITQYGALFLNSSFGFPALPALDLASGGPNYPLATPFVRVQFQPSGEITMLGAVYNGDPAPPGTGDAQLRDRHGTAFRLNDHTLSFAELQYSPAMLANFGQPGTYKFGMWIATGLFADPVDDSAGLPLASPAGTGVPLLHATDHAVYAVIDQMLWHKPNTEAQGLGLFVQVMHAPDDRNLSDFFVEGGLNWKGIIPGRSHDEAGLAVTHAGIGAAAVHFSNDVLFFTGLGAPYSPGETIVEATYRARLTPWLKLQPDLQYVVNPGAGIPSTESLVPLKNALVVGVRATVDF
jgi:porin